MKAEVTLKKEANLEACPTFETVCIEVLKAYDFCFQPEHRENNCIPLGGVQVPPDAFIDCQVNSFTCTEVSRTTPTPEGRSNVLFAITVEITVTIFDNIGCIIFQQTQTFIFTKTVVLCAPEGTFTTCELPNVACSCVVVGDQVCCTLDLCVVIEVLAAVKLLVPSFGFCVPAICREVSPGPPFVCPPNLFPPQCRIT